MPRHPWHQRGDRWVQAQQRVDAAAAEAAYWHEMYVRSGGGIVYMPGPASREERPNVQLAVALAFVLGVIAGIVLTHLHGR